MVIRSHRAVRALAVASLFFAVPSTAQDDITPFWRAVDSLNLGNAINDLYTDLTLIDTIKLGG